MEYLEGANLTEIVGRGVLSLGVALHIVGRVADALHYAFHLVDDGGGALRMVHRDIKPSNVLVTSDGDVKVLDFGVARADFSERESDTGVHVLGSMHYLAPERFEGESGPESDIYGLGVVLFEVLVGERMGRSSPDPRRHDTFLQKVRLRLLDALGGAGAGVVEIVVQMLAHSPSLRPQANEVRERCFKLLRFLDPIDMPKWAAEVAGGLARTRSHTSPSSPDWPERVGRTQWAGHDATDALLWSTSGDVASTDQEEGEDTLSLVFGDASFTDETSMTDPIFIGADDATQPASGHRLVDSQETTAPNVKGAPAPTDQLWDPEDRDGGFHAMPDGLGPGQTRQTRRVTRDAQWIVWLVLVGLLLVLGAALVAIILIMS